MPAGGLFPDIPGASWSLPLIALIVVSAIGYSVATIGMKFATTGLSAIALALILSGFMAATVAEIILLRNADLGVVYITIIGVETLLVLSFAAFIGEGLNLRGMLGAGFVLGGIALVSAH
ncbi:MAG: 5-aminolevulinate synthase [Pararhodobacter sp.]|nr:5-aminolevulinate synthase [Pararhodobacter sp.]